MTTPPKSLDERIRSWLTEQGSAEFLEVFGQDQK